MSAPADPRPRKIFAWIGGLLLLAGAWQVTAAATAWLDRDEAQVRRRAAALAAVKERTGTRFPRALRFLEEDRLDRESMRALEALLADRERPAHLPYLLRDLERFEGRLPEQLVVEWAGVEPRMDLDPPGAIASPARAVGYAREFPSTPDGALVLRLVLSWLALALLLIAAGRALREPGAARSFAAGGVWLALPAVLLSAVALGLGHLDGSAPAHAWAWSLLGLAFEAPALVLAAACGLAHWRALGRDGYGAGSRQALVSGVPAGLLLAGWGALVLAAADWQPGVTPSMAEALREVFALPAPGLASTLAGALRGAVQEEIAFRLLLLGGLFRLARDRDPEASPIPAVLISTLVWSGLHLGLLRPDLVKLAQVFPAGLLLAWLQLRKGAGAAMTAHVTWNTIGVWTAAFV